MEGSRQGGRSQRVNHNPAMLARLMAFVVWGLLACSGAYWLIQIMAKPLTAPADALPAVEQSGGQADLSRLFGATVVAAPEPAAAVESRFKLLGVVAPKTPRGGQVSSREGVALIAVDGVARTVRVGAVVEGDLQLLAVDARSASLGQGGVVTLTLQLAPPTQATTGALMPAERSPTILGGDVQQGMPQQQQQQQPPPLVSDALPGTLQTR